KGEMLNQDQKANRVSIEREEYRNIANNRYGKRRRNDEWDLRKSEDRSRRELEDKVNGKKEKADKGKSKIENRNIKVDEEDNLEIAVGIIKKKEAITMGSGCKMASNNEQKTEQFKEEENQEEEYSQLKIGMHNINRIKLNEQKLIDLAEYGKKEGLDIIGIIETNLMEKE
ncbi:11367_t:CDS:2, partial [Gigaspora rosea]